METHHALTDTEFARQFADCTLPPALFSHEAHLRLAWIHLRAMSESVAIMLICKQLRQYTRFLGVGEKYHETVTIAAVKIVNQYMQRTQAATFAAFITEFPQLNTHFRELLATHYSGDIFDNAQARQTWLEPDLLPFA